MTDARALTITTPTDREIVMTRAFDAPRNLVFKALTTPELLKRWLYGPEEWSLAECEIDLRVGGAFRYVWRKAGVPEMGMGGVYREVVPPERIVHTELFDEDWTGGETLVTTLLTERAGTTTLTTTVLYPTREARDGALETGMEEGLAAGYDRLARLLVTMSATPGAPARA